MSPARENIFVIFLVIKRDLTMMDINMITITVSVLNGFAPNVIKNYPGIEYIRMLKDVKNFSTLKTLKYT